MRPMSAVQPVRPEDLPWLERAIDLAEQGLEAGDQPFGSVLVSGQGEELFADHNHVSGGDHTRHPELAAAQWAAEHLTPTERAAATVYTSGEHCAMCSAAHAWVGLGPIVYAADSASLGIWRSSWGALTDSPVLPLSIGEVAPGVEVRGPAPSLQERIRGLHEEHARRHPAG